MSITTKTVSSPLVARYRVVANIILNRVCFARDCEYFVIIIIITALLQYFIVVQPTFYRMIQ